MKGIIVASFGTSFNEVRKRSLDKIEKAIADAFSNHEIRRAFTSNMIIKKLKNRDGLIIDTPTQAINRMINDGIKNIHVQPLHVIPGFEYEKVKRAVSIANHKNDVKVTIGLPLLSHEQHYDELLDVIFEAINIKNKNEAYVLMGHGTKHHANACYSMLQAKIHERNSNVFIANVEGYPEIHQIQAKLSAYNQITLMPLMIVAGDHARNDMAGEEEESYKSILEKDGKEVRCILKGLGELEKIHEIFVSRVKEFIA